MTTYHRKRKGAHMLQLHRVIMEASIGRKLSTTELVHHINADPHDNRIENLQIVSAKEHCQHHNQRHPWVKICAVCGDFFEPGPTHREETRCCGRGCGGVLAAETRRAG